MDKIQHRDSLLRSVGWAMASNITQEGLVALITLVLASLLLPSDFGLVAMALIYLNFVQLVLGFGFVNALIQKPDLEDRHLNSVFWINMLCSAVLCGLTIAGSGICARANHMERLQPVLIVLAAVVPLQGLALVQQALLQRNMDFKRLALRDNLSALIGGVTGVTLAVLKFGVWALVAQQLIRYTVGVITLWQVSHWRPRRQFEFACVRPMLRFSSKVFVGQIGTFAQGQTDSLLVGVLFGPAAVGLYRLADRLVEMVLKFVTRAFQIVSLPHFSKVQHDRAELNNALAFICRTSGIVTIPALVFMATNSHQVVAALGPQWLFAAGILRIFCLIGFVKAITSFIGPLLQAVSRPGISAWNVWCLAIINGLAVGTVAIFFRSSAAENQITMVAAIRASVFLLVFLPINLVQAQRMAGISVANLARALSPAFLIAAAVAVVSLLVQRAAEPFEPNPRLLLAATVVIVGATWLALVLATEKQARRTFYMTMEKAVVWLR